MSDVRLIDSRELHKRLSDLSERWYRAKKFGVAQGLAMAIEEVCNTDTIDPLRAAGGCYCRECKHHKPIDYCGLHRTSGWLSDRHCSYGEAREAQDDG